MKRVLLTGFEPFGGEQVNPALEAANKLHNREIIPGEFIITTHALPTVFGESINTIIEKVQEIKPSIIICTGQAGGRSALSIERIAINIDDARIKDNMGNLPVDRPINPAGPAAYFSTLPGKAIIKELQKNKIPAAISNSAGTYVCNHVLYGLLDFLNKQQLNIPAGFIHVPYLPEQVIGKANTPSMSLDVIVKGLELAILKTIKAVS